MKVISPSKLREALKNRDLLGKLFLPVLVLLISVALVSGCTGMATIARGWSGGVVVGDILYLGSMEGNLVTIRTSDGARLWSVSLETVASSGGFGCASGSTSVAIYGAPAVVSSTVDGEVEYTVYVAGYNGRLYAFDYGKSDWKWVYPRDTVLGSIVGSPVVAGDRVYFASGNGQVYALEAEGLFLVWEFETGGKIWSTPAIDGETLFVGSFDKKLYALDTNDGSQRWNFETGGAIVTTPVVYDGTVYFGSFDRCLYAVDISSGEELWRFPADDAESEPGNWFWANPVIYDGVIYAPCLDGKVYALDVADGALLVAFDLGSPVSSSPVVSGDAIIVATEGGSIYALNIAGSQQWELARLEEKIRAALTESEGFVYIHTAKDSLYALDVASGALREFSIK